MKDPKREYRKDEEEEDNEPSRTPDNNYSVDNVSSLYDFSFYGSVSSEVEDHRGLIKLLRNAKETDFIRLRMSSRGGSVQTGFVLLSAIKQCRAHIQAEIEAPCYSMASVIALACDSLVFAPGTFLMFHNYSGMSFGKGSELKDYVDNQAKLNSDMDKLYCIPFLTKKEVEDMSRDIDIYIRWDDKSLPSRMKRHFK